MRALGLVALLAIAPVALLGSCRREPEKRPRTEPWPAPLAASSSPATPALAAARSLYVLERGSVTIELLWGTERARATLGTLRAELEVEGVDAATARGFVDADLDSLVLFGEGGDPDQELTNRARATLGLARPGEASTGSRRSARFDLGTLAAGTRGTFVARGDLSLHGIRAPEAVDLTISPSLDGLAAPPERVVIRSTGGLVVSLSTHDLRPEPPKATRDPRASRPGKAPEARVGFELFLTKKR